MARLVISENISLDGVVEDPTGEEGFVHGGWFERHMGEDRAAWAELEFAEARGAQALLLGRRTDAYFGSRWNAAPGEWADRLRQLPKYVVSSTLVDPVWVNSTVLRGGAVAETARLRDELDGEIVVYASRELVRALLEAGLVDEIRLVVFPVLLGAGERLFGETADQSTLRLLAAKRVGGNLAQLSYEVVRGD